MSGSPASFEEFSSARRRQRSTAEAAEVLSGTAPSSSSTPLSRAPSSTDAFLSTVAAQRWVLTFLTLELFFALYLYTFRSTWQVALEPLRERHGGFVQYIPSVAAFFAWIADFGAYFLWLISFGEMILWIASAIDTVTRVRSAAGVTAAKTAATVLQALLERPLRVMDAFAVIFYAGILAVRGDSVRRLFILLRCTRIMDAVFHLESELRSRTILSTTLLLDERRRAERLRAQNETLVDGWDAEARARSAVEGALREANEELALLREALVVAAEEAGNLGMTVPSAEQGGGGEGKNFKFKSSNGGNTSGAPRRGLSEMVSSLPLGSPIINNHTSENTSSNNISDDKSRRSGGSRNSSANGASGARNTFTISKSGAVSRGGGGGTGLSQSSLPAVKADDTIGGGGFESAEEEGGGGVDSEEEDEDDTADIEELAAAAGLIKRRVIV